MAIPSLHHQEAMEVDEPHCTPEEALSVLIENNLSCNLRVLGSQLGLKPSDLDILLPLGQSRPYQQQLIQILSKCNERELLSLTKIVSVLRKPALKQYRVASRICNKYKIMAGSSESDSISSMQSPRSGSLESSLTFSYSLSQENEPEISEVVNEIADVRDWERLAISLGLTTNDIDMIKQYDHREYYQRMVEMWYDRDQDYSWNKLRRELDKLYPRRESNASVISSPPDIDSPQADVESQIKKFERKFQDLNIEARKELEEKHNSRCVEILKDELTSLPRSIAREHHKYVTSLTKRKHPFTNLSLFFQHLNLYCWNFLEYQVLESLIEGNCSEFLKDKMSRYAKDVEGFRQKTTITDFIKCGRHLVKKKSIPPRFKKITLEHAIDPDVYTLAELDAFRKDTLEALQLKLSECAFQVYRIKHGSVIVKWMIPEDFAGPLSNLFISEAGQKLLHKHRVEKIKIDKDAIQIQSFQLFLLTAAKNGDLHGVLSLLEDERTDINYQDPEGMTALHFAAMEGHVEILELLLKNGCNVNVTAGEGMTALHFAAMEGHVEILELLLKKGCNVNVTAGKKGCTPLQLVCLNRDNPSKRRAEMAKLLLDHDTKLYVEDTDGRTPLFAASRSGFVDIVKVILEKVAELPQRKQRRALNHTMMNGWTPIMDAAMHGHAEVIKLLLEAGATAIKTKEDDETALHIAAYHGHVEAVKVLTANQDRFVINARDQYGLTPLMMATSNGKVEAANVLLEAGADVNLQSNDKERRTALMFAATNGVFSIVKLLLKYKPDVSIKDSSNNTAMDLAKTLEIRHCLKVSPESIKKEQVGVSS